MFLMFGFLFSVLTIIYINRKLLYTMSNFKKTEFILSIGIRIIVVQSVIKLAIWCRKRNT